MLEKETWEKLNPFSRVVGLMLVTARATLFYNPGPSMEDKSKVRTKSRREEPLSHPKGESRGSTVRLECLALPHT